MRFCELTVFPFTNTSEDFLLVLGFDVTLLQSGSTIKVNDPKGNTVWSLTVSNNLTVGWSYSSGSGTNNNLNSSVLNTTQLAYILPPRIVIPPGYSIAQASLVANSRMIGFYMSIEELKP